MQNHFRVILIAGPTASGKSALAIRLANDLKGVIINADSMQVYSDLRVITARPNEVEEKQAPHKLYGTLDGAKACSAVEWSDLAMAEIRLAWNSGLMPILVGGTGMYFKTLLEGLVTIPTIDEEIRQAIRSEITDLGPEILHEKLKTLDPTAYERLAPADSQRISRALEVVMSTRKALSDWQEEPQKGYLTKLDQQGRIAKIVIDIERDQLYERCEARLEMMIEDGAVHEVRELLGRNLDPALPIMKALGVPSLSAYILEKLSYDKALVDAKTQTRQFAKRQLTWFRNQFSEWERVSAQLMERKYGVFLNYLNKKWLD